MIQRGIHLSAIRVALRQGGAELLEKQTRWDGSCSNGLGENRARDMICIQLEPQYDEGQHETLATDAITKTSSTLSLISNTPVLLRKRTPSAQTHLAHNSPTQQ